METPFKAHIKQDPITHSATVMDGAVSALMDAGDYSLQFDGSNDYVDLNATDIVPNLTAALSIGAFVSSATTGAIQSIIGNLRDLTTVGWQFKISSNHQLEFQFYTPAGSKRAWGDTPDLLIGNDLTFVGVTFDGNTARFYIDGTEIVKETLGTTVTISENTAQNVRIGHRQAAGSGFEFFSGTIDEIRVYDRALSAAEMSNLYSQILAGDADLIGQWGFNEGTGTSVADGSSFGNTGTLNGAAWSQDNTAYLMDDTSALMGGPTTPYRPRIKQ